MEFIRRRATYARYGRVLIIIIYLVGWVGLSRPDLRDTFIKLSSLNLLFSFMMLIVFHQNFNLKQVVWFSVVTISAFIIELVGVQSGLIFGNYQYGSSLGIKIANTPLLIGLNWWMLTYMVYHVFQRWEVSNFLKSLTGASIMLMYDVLLEPLARPLDFWYWQAGNVPLQNYLAWAFMSFAFLWIWNVSKLSFKNRLANTLLITQMSFFLLLNITYGNV